MNIIDEIKQRAKANKKRIILPESMDLRVLKAASICADENIADITLIGDEQSIKEDATKNDIDLSKVTIINPLKHNLTDELINTFYELRKEKGMTLEEARKTLLEDYMYYACMLVHKGEADGIVSGACHSTANTLRPALQIIKTAPNSKLVSAFFLMAVPNCEYGDNGTFIFADSGLEQNPTPEKLAAIAASSSDSFELLTGHRAMTALLSHSTKGSAKHPDVDKVLEALKIVKEEYPEYQIDGELQLDAAIVPEIAATKAPDSKIAGHANVLVFPDLDAGNIGYKLVQRLAKAEAYGPITQGIKKPVNDLSRGCSVEDIVGVVAITSVQSTK
ncbi:MAG TPA: phosphate acetyltransferase [Firmicutes bacterium]|nr:phosphate acetyltransferase [Bacillota bacterium]